MKPFEFYVKAIWDAEAGVWVSESDIIGLHVEAASLEEFEAAAAELGPQLIPWIKFRAPQTGGAAAA